MKTELATRRAGGIAGKHIDWPRYDKFVGVLPDPTLARIMRVAPYTVQARRAKLGRPRATPASMARLLAELLHIPTQ